MITIPIIDTIEKIVKDIPGWSPIDQLYTLFNLAYLSGRVEGDIIEVGSWCGRSSIVLGLAAKLTGNTKVYCIDLFPDKDSWKENVDGTYSFEVEINGGKFQAYQKQTVWAEPFKNQTSKIYEKYNNVYDCFKETVAKNNQQDIIVSHRGNSSSFVKKLNNEFKAKLIFIDADHGYEAVRQDIENLQTYLVSGGWICFDDAFTCYEGINKALKELIIENQSFELCHQLTRKLFVARKK